MDRNAMAELERGDGAWENIQEVLRREFLELWAAVVDKKSRSAKNEQRLRVVESGLAEKAECESFKQQQRHVEAIARAVNALSEELRSRDAQLSELEEHTSAQLDASLAKLRDDFQSQLGATEIRLAARATDVQDSCRALLMKAERRLALLEEELSILVAAIDKKADVESVDASLLAQKREAEDAIRKRCKKTAFDNEVLALHDLLRHQHSAIDARLEDALAQLRETTETQLQHEISKIAALRDEKCLQHRQECEERSSRLESAQSELLSQAEAALSKRIDEELLKSNSAASNDSEETKLWLRGVQEELTLLQQAQELTFRAEQESANQRMKEGLEHQLLVWKESVSKDWTQLQSRVNEGATKLEAINQLERDQTSLRGVSEALQADLARTTAALSDLEQRLLTDSQAKMQELHAQLSKEISRVLQTLEASKRAKDKKLRLQLDASSEKLVELDQIVKLVGKQLIQNTSQLQLFRKEQHARRQVYMAEELVHFSHENLLLSASEELDSDGIGDDELLPDGSAQPSRSNNNGNSAAPETPGELDTDEPMEQLRSQHETLRHAIRDKLRHYQEVLQQE